MPTTLALIPDTARIRPIRYCTGGCSHPDHRPHYYQTDPVDGPLDKEYLCPGNTGGYYELFEVINGRETTLLEGFIPETTQPPRPFPHPPRSLNIHTPPRRPCRRHPKPQVFCLLSQNLLSHNHHNHHAHH